MASSETMEKLKEFVREARESYGFIDYGGLFDAAVQMCTF